jgi:hypothetical protein
MCSVWRTIPLGRLFGRYDRQIAGQERVRTAGAMRERDVHFVHAVFERLQIVARNVLDRPRFDDPLTVRFGIGRKRGRLVVTEEAVD